MKTRRNNLFKTLIMLGIIGLMINIAPVQAGNESTDNSIGDGYIIQKISTGEAYEVHLKPGIFPAEQDNLEKKIRSLRAAGQTVTPGDIDSLDKMAEALSRKLLNTARADILYIKPLAHYQFIPIDLFGRRGDVINKAMPRQ